MFFLPFKKILKYGDQITLIFSLLMLSLELQKVLKYTHPVSSNINILYDNGTLSTLRS